MAYRTRRIAARSSRTSRSTSCAGVPSRSRWPRDLSRDARRAAAGRAPGRGDRVMGVASAGGLVVLDPKDARRPDVDLPRLAARDDLLNPCETATTSIELGHDVACAADCAEAERRVDHALRSPGALGSGDEWTEHDVSHSDWRRQSRKRRARPPRLRGRRGAPSIQTLLRSGAAATRTAARLCYARKTHVQHRNISPARQFQLRGCCPVAVRYEGGYGRPRGLNP